MNFTNFRLYWDCSGSGSSSDLRLTPGDIVDRSGVYQVQHPDGRSESVVFVRGQKFPACACCGESVRYLLMRAAPYIYEDQDFQDD